MANQVENIDCIAPKEVAQGFSEKVMPAKANLKKTKMIVLAIAAGAFVAFGAQASLCVACGTEAACGWGIARILSGIVFATGLMMVVLTGAELFTGNVLMMFSVIKKKIKWYKLVRSWAIVYFGNFIGSLILAYLIFYSGSAHFNHDALGALTLATAKAKVSLTFTEAFTRGIMCNWLVCVAVWMATSSQRVIGKVFAIFFPMVIFVASGYEHSVANMFFIPNGILTKTIPSVVEAANLTQADLSLLTWKGFFVNNLVPVTLGNIVGATIFVVLLFWLAYLRDDRHKD